MPERKTHKSLIKHHHVKAIHRIYPVNEGGDLRSKYYPVP